MELPNKLSKGNQQELKIMVAKLEVMLNEIHPAHDRYITDAIYSLESMIDGDES